MRFRDRPHTSTTRHNTLRRALNRLLLSGIVLLTTLSLSACSKFLAESEYPAPTITLDSPTDSYSTKINEQITITPTYENIDGAQFEWSLDGATLSNGASLTYTWSEVGDYYIILVVSNRSASSYREIKVSVNEVAPPTITLIESLDSYYVAEGIEFTLSPSVTNNSGARYSWTLNGEEISTLQSLTHTIDEIGEYELIFTATNSDGSNFVEVDLRVVAEDDLPFSWSFEQVSYNLSSGREIRLKCWNVEGDFGGDYLWTMGGEELQRGSSSEYIFGRSTVGEYIVTVSKLNTKGNEVASQELTINVCEAEGRYKRAVSSDSSASFDRVYEFLAAPGQYTNNGYSCTTMEEATAYAEMRLAAGAYLSLGAFGGYVVVGFDHSVDNSGGYDIQIKGNYSSTSNEPGIVMVMQDENGDGLPNDTWYELAGGETEQGTQISDYSITYFKPSAAASSVQWIDNQGGSGTVDDNTTHTQSSYYPEWADGDSVTFYGTALASKTYSISSSSYVNPPFSWGYADNQSDIDTLPDGDTSADSLCNYFKISNAVDYNGDKVSLDYIDFVKIYTAVNDKAGWLGELSTEVLGVSDYNIKREEQ